MRQCMYSKLKEDHYYHHEYSVELCAASIGLIRHIYILTNRCIQNEKKKQCILN